MCIRDRASNTQLLLTKYRAIQLFNFIFLHAEFESSREAVDLALEEVAACSDFMDDHTLLIINYKAAIYFFALNELDRAESMADQVIDSPDSLRMDLKGFARILRLIIYYERADEDSMERKARTAYNFLEQQENLGALQLTVLDFINKLGNIYPQDIKKSFIALKKELEALKENPIQARALLYFDIISYLDAKIQNKSFAQVIREKVIKENA